MAVAAIERARILVVDDDASTRELLTEVLTGEGHIVVAEATGRDGLARAIAEPFDLILSDIGLPDLDGIRLVQGLRAAGVRAPMVALSGHTDEVDRQKGRAAGFDDYLFKPIRASTLRSEIARRLSGEYGPADAARSGSDPRLASAATAPAVAEPAVVALAESTLAKPRPRGVLGGLVVIAMGVPFVMQPLGVPNAASYLFVAMGGAFLVSYLRSRQYVYLIPMVTLVSFGVALLLPTWISLRPETVAPAFVAVIALGFVLAFALAPDRRWPLVPAAILGIVAGSRLVTGISPIPSALEPFLVPVVLMAVGGYLLIERPT
jgi:CheY-like chemotaxis protein